MGPCNYNSSHYLNNPTFKLSAEYIFLPSAKTTPFAKPTVVPPGDIIFFISILYVTNLTFRNTSPVNFTVPTPKALPFPGFPIQPKKNPTSCHIASSPRQPGITGSSLKWQSKNQRSFLMSNSAFNDPFLKAPLLSLISVILSNISIGGRGNLAFPGPNNSPFPQFISSS